MVQLHLLRTAKRQENKYPCFNSRLAKGESSKVKEYFLWQKP
jgi:hypothetical protein